MTTTNISALLAGASGVVASSKKRIVVSSAAVLTGVAGVNPYTGSSLVGASIGSPTSSFEEEPNAAFRFLLSQDPRPTSVFSGYNDQINIEVAAKSLVGNATKKRGLASSITVVAPLKLEDNKLTYDSSDAASITNSLQLQVNLLTASLTQERAERQADVENLNGRIDELIRALDSVRTKLYAEVQGRVDAINSLISGSGASFGSVSVTLTSLQSQIDTVNGTLTSHNTRISAHATVLNNYKTWWTDYWLNTSGTPVYTTGGSGYINAPSGGGLPSWPPATVS